MKKVLFLIFIISLSVNALAYDNRVSTINGSSNLHKENYSSLEVNGSLTFGDLTIEDLFIINGSIQGENLKCKKIKSNGSVMVNGLQAQKVACSGSFIGENIRITDSSEFHGGVKITRGKLNNIKIASTTSTLIDTEIEGNIFLKKIDKDKNLSFFDIKYNKLSEQILELKGKTLVKGNVIFEEKSEIHLFDEAKIIGEIVNAKIVKK